MNYAPLSKFFVLPQMCRHITITLDPRRFNYKTAKRKLVKYSMSRIKDILDDHCTSYHMVLEFTKQMIPHYHGYVYCLSDDIYTMLFLRISERIGRVQIDEIRDRDKFTAYCTDEKDRTHTILNYKMVKRILTKYNVQMPIDIYNDATEEQIRSNMKMLKHELDNEQKARRNLLQWVHKLDGEASIQLGLDDFDLMKYNPESIKK